MYTKMFENEKGFWWHEGMRKITDRLMKLYLARSNDLRILDIGCGTGGWFSLLSHYGAVYGIDKSDDAIFFAKKQGIAKSIVKGDVDTLPYCDSSFDTVTCFDVLYHRWIKDDQRIINEIYRVLKKNGTLIIREASYNWLMSQHDTLVWTRHRYTPAELKLKLATAGLTVARCTFLNFFLFPVVLIKRLVEKIKPDEDPLATMYIVPWLVNQIFYLFLYFESILIPFINFPFGLSIICIAKKIK